MANTTSQIMTNEIANPRLVSNIREKHSRVRTDVCRVATATADGAAHIYRLTKLKAHDAVLSIRFFQLTADAGFTAVDVGIYTPSSDTTDPVAVDADGLVDGQALTAGGYVGEQLLGLGANAGLEADFGKGLWEYCQNGPASAPDPGTEYEICATVGDAAQTQTVVFVIEYVAGD